MATLKQLVAVALVVPATALSPPHVGRRAFVGTLGGALSGITLLPETSLAGTAVDADGFFTTASGLKIRDIKQPEMGAASITNAFKAGDYIRVDYKIFLDGFGKTLIDDTDKTGPVEIQLGVGSTEGSTGLQKSALKVPLLKGMDEACQGQTVGSKRQVVIPPQLAYGNGGKTGIGFDVPAGKTVFVDFRVRGRVFAGQLKRPQENFRENDQVTKINGLLGIGL